MPKAGTGAFSCTRCASQHQPKQCLAHGKECAKCKGMEHLTKQCFSKNKSQSPINVHAVEEIEFSETFFVGMIMVIHKVFNEDMRQKNEMTDVSNVSQDKWIVSLKSVESLCN